MSAARATPCAAGRCEGAVECGHHRLQAENTYKWLDAIDGLPRVSRRQRAATRDLIATALNPLSGGSGDSE